jgi:hypothetical protein
MKKLIVQVTDSEKAEMLSKLLIALDFVDSVENIEDKDDLEKTEILSEDKEDFFTLAGLWENQDITIDSIRKQAGWEKLK